LEQKDLASIRQTRAQLGQSRLVYGFLQQAMLGGGKDPGKTHRLMIQPKICPGGLRSGVNEAGFFFFDGQKDENALR
jgi:hypothetical protein